MATLGAVESLRQARPELLLSHQKTLLKSSINARVRSSLSHLDPLVGSYLSSPVSHIRPDGGLVWLSLGRKQFLLGVVEAKKQGTNDSRFMIGKPKQSKGNAIERSAKNFLEICCHQLDEDIMPYAIFATGCDLEDGSSTADRLTCLTLGGPFNRLTVKKVGGVPRASVFVGLDRASMESVVFRMLSESADYYISKYGKGGD